ncbi:uncharacterized protein LOC134700462, partial [Mytilus trossulus]|uniref:uncharacterized protein LOC134700462 n=1 Tax=Mytilus trossulus TaxID=6551 RepID=UPI003004901A
KYTSHTHKQLTAERLKDVENLEHPGHSIYELPPSDKQFTYNTHHARVQPTSEHLKELENDYLTSVLPANIDSFASSQLRFTVEDIANASYHNQRPVLSTEYADYQNLSEMESESDIKESEDNYNQTNRMKVLQRDAITVRVDNDSINLHVIDVVNHTPDNKRVGLESDKERSSTQSNDSTVSPLTALIEVTYTG